MARRKQRENTRPSDGEQLEPPPSVYNGVVWGYSHERQQWFLPEKPTREELIKHAERFGTDQVAETAAEIGFTLEDLTFLIERLDQIDVMRAKKEGLKFGAKQKRTSAEKRAKKMLNWTEPETDDEEADAA